MRFIVDLYRYVIFVLCAVVLIGTIVMVLFAVGSRGPDGPDITGLTVAIAVGALVFLILNLGGIAILVSVHDRHVELVEEATELNASLVRIAVALERPNAPWEAER